MSSNVTPAIDPTTVQTDFLALARTLRTVLRTGIETHPHLSAEQRAQHRAELDWMAWLDTTCSNPVS